MQGGGGQVSVPLRAGKKMRKRRELDALAGGGGAGGRRLLAGSSDEREDGWSWGPGVGGAGVVAGGRSRRRRPRCAPAARACAALLLCACATATATVVWLFIDVREQITSLRSQMELVSVGSQGVGDALQRCHSTARELQHNHTEMAAKLDRLILRTDNLTSQVTALQAGLSSVKQQVASAPELVNVPEQLTSLGANVARFGSQIKDFDSTVASLRTQSIAVSDNQAVLQKNVTQLKIQIDEISNKSLTLDGFNSAKSLEPYIKQQSDLQMTVTQLSTNVSSINETLATKINWATQDFQNDHHKVSGLLESVQNNSAALSSLQTAWRQSNEILSRNLTELTMKLAEKSSELQNLIDEMQHLKDHMSKVEQNQVVDFTKETNPNSMPFDVAGGKEDMPSNDVEVKSQEAQQAQNAPAQTSKTFHERNSENEDLLKVLGSSTVSPLSTSTKAAAIISKIATGKPSILSSSGGA